MPKKTPRPAPTSLRKGRERPGARKVRVHPFTRSDSEPHPKGMLVGYARVFTLDRNPASQRHALAEAAAGRVRFLASAPLRRSGYSRFARRQLRVAPGPSSGPHASGTSFTPPASFNSLPIRCLESRVPHRIISGK